MLCFPQSTRQAFSLLPSGDCHWCPAGWEVPAKAFPEASIDHPAQQAGKKRWSVTLRKEIPPLQLGGFNPQLTELSTAYARLLQRSTKKFTAWKQPTENLNTPLN